MNQDIKSSNRIEKGQDKQVLDTRYWKARQRVWFLIALAGVAGAWALSRFTPNVQAINTLPYQIFLIGFFIVLLLTRVLAVFSKKLYTVLFHRSQFIFAVAVSLAIWDLLTTKSAVLPLPFFPGPAQIILVLVNEREMLLFSAAHSMALFFTGLIAGTILGLTSGVLIGWYRQWNYWLFPLIKVTGIVPAVAWIPVAIVILPNSFAAGVFLIVISSWFTIALMVSGGISSTPKAYYEVARTLGAKEHFLLFRVAIPHAVPHILTGISTATGLAFLTLVVSEMVGAKAGLGWYINWAKAWSAYDKVYASIIIMALVFSIILTIISALRNYLLRWQKGIIR